MSFDKCKISKELLTVNDIVDIADQYRPNGLLRRINYNSKDVTSFKPMQLAMDSKGKNGAMLEMNYDRLTKELLTAHGTELCNALIILYMFHELEHVRTLELFRKKKLDPYEYLVKTSMLQCDLLPGTYQRKHDTFLSEYNANTMSLKRFFDEFSDVLSQNTLIRINKGVAENLYRGYTLVPENYDFLRNSKMVKSPIKRVLDYNRAMFEFQKIRKAINDTSDLGLLYGGDITFSDLEKVRDVSCYKLKTPNIFNEIK